MQKIPGFESTAYASLHGRIVWAGEGAGAEHPRNVHKPWHAPPRQFDARALGEGARTCLTLITAGSLGAPKGLLLWLVGRPLPFPLDLATPRFDAVADSLTLNDMVHFETAALRVLGLGPGLTPSGDDFVGAIFFALAHAPREDWRRRLPALKARIRRAAETATHVVSAALLDDLIDGASHRALHDMVAALQSGARPEMERATKALLRLGASSGADMLAGLLLALITQPAEHAVRARRQPGAIQLRALGDPLTMPRDPGDRPMPSRQSARST